MLAGFTLAFFLAVGTVAHAGPIKESAKAMTEAQKRELATQAFGACTKYPLPNEMQRLWFGLTMARATHIDREDMKGTPEGLGSSLCILELQGLRQWGSSEEITLAVERGELVEVSTDLVDFDKNQKLERRLLTPFARAFFMQLADDFAQAFPGRKYKVTSLLRTVSEQKAIARKKMSPLDCEVKWYCSAHTTGVAFDISLRGLTAAEIEYLRLRLRYDIAYMRIVAIKEEKSGCFHVQVTDPAFVAAALVLFEHTLPNSGKNLDPQPPKLPIPGKPVIET